MNPTTTTILDQILALPREEREELVHYILVSLEPETQEEAIAEAANGSRFSRRAE